MAVTVRISPQKASRILHFFFEGMPQPEIARKFGINQATVSRYVLRLKEEADSKGLMTAAEEYEVMHEVDSLRSLATELSKNKLTLEESKEGVDILKSFSNLGVSPAEHESLIKVVSKLKNSDFVPAAMKLAELEASTGKSYGKIVSEFERVSTQITELKEHCAALGEKRESLRQAVEKLTIAKKNKAQELHQLEDEARQKQLSLDKELAGKMKEVGLTLKRIENLTPLTVILKKSDIPDDKLETYLKEHQELEEAGVTWEDFQTIVRSMEDETSKIGAEKLVKCLAEYGSLDRAIEEMEPELISSKAQLEELEEKRKTLKAEVAGLSKRKTSLKEETNQLEKKKQALSKTIGTMRAEEKELKEYLPGLRDSVKTLEARKLDLEKRGGELDQKIKEREERLRVLTGTNEALEEKARLLKELEAKIAATGLRFQLFEGLLGFIRADTGAEMERFLISLPRVIAEAKRGKDDADFLKKYVLRKLTGNTLKVAACRECGVEFMVVGRTGTERSESYLTYRTEPKHCPICGTSSGLITKMEIAQALADELKPPAETTRYRPVRRTPTDANFVPVRRTPTDANFVPVTPTPTDAKLEKVEEGKTDKEAGK